MLTVVLLSYLRRNTLNQCVDGILRQSRKPDNFVVWHNAPSAEPVDGVDNIFAGKNYGCSARHVAALLYPCKHILFIDDDVILKHPQAIEKVHYFLLSGEHMVGACGRNLVHGDRPYSKAGDVNLTAGPVDVCKGWFHGMSRELAIRCLEFLLPDDIRGEDDITASAVCQLMLCKSPKLIPFATGAFTMLRDRIGNMNRPDHKKRRDDACKYFVDLGWQPQSWKASDVQSG
jgi:hypothetical protein